jgi:hypothetical protein
LTAFLLEISDNVSSSGSGAAISASRHRSSTLKETIVSNLYKYFKYNFLTIPGIFEPPSYIHHHTTAAGNFPANTISRNPVTSMKHVRRTVTNQTYVNG